MLIVKPTTPTYHDRRASLNAKYAFTHQDGGWMVVIGTSIAFIPGVLGCDLISALGAIIWTLMGTGWVWVGTRIIMKRENRMTEMYNQLLKEVAYAKASLSPRDLLYEAHGAIKMAHQLGAITVDEYLALETACVKEGINNPIYFK